MVKYALLARVEAKAGKEEAVEQFLSSALALAQEEEETVSWYALKIGPPPLESLTPSTMRLVATHI